MERHDLITTILGVIFGVATVLIFSFVVAEKVKQEPPRPGGSVSKLHEAHEADKR